MILVHRCIKCGAEFESSDDVLLSGCSKCGSKFFEYHQADGTKKIQESTGTSIETIMVKGYGVYEVNLSSLLEDESIIISNEEGKYLIDINYLLKKHMREKE